MKRKRNNNIPKSRLLAFLSILLLASLIKFSNDGTFLMANTSTLLLDASSKEYPATQTQTTMAQQFASPPEPIAIDLLLGKINPAADPFFEEVKPKHASGPGMFLQYEAYDAFVKMFEAAQADGINLVIVSAMRTFNHQRRIWNNKWNGRQMLEGNINATSIKNPVVRAREILRYSAMPGTSRHHWGTDIDLNSVENSYFESEQGKMVYQWLLQNAATFGFCQPYSAHGYSRQGGHEEEKWHWSYKPVSEKYFKAFIHYVGYEQIAGFNGWKTAREIGVIESYVMEVNGECKSLTNNEE